jgi:oxalate decarboxylase
MPPGSTSTRAAAIVFDTLNVFESTIFTLPPHPNTDEWQYYLSGEAKMTVFAAEGRARTFNYQASCLRVRLPQELRQSFLTP